MNGHAHRDLTAKVAVAAASTPGVEAVTNESIEAVLIVAE
jgi:hypothetical protein